MSGAITAQEAVEARNRIEGALAARINQALDLLDAYAGETLPQPADAGYIAEQNRIDLFFEADRVKHVDDAVASQFGASKSKFVWAAQTCQTFPGRNRFVKKLGGGLELWLRIEFAFHGWAGFSVYDSVNHSLICFGDIPQEIVDSLFGEFGITSDDVADNCWWAFGRYLPEGLEEMAPNFRLMDDLSIALIDDAAFDEYIEKSKALLDELLALVVVDCVH